MPSSDNGCSKTHVAVEYAHKFHRELPGAHVYWVNAGSAEQFELSFKRIAETLNLGKTQRKNGKYLEGVRRALKEDVSGHWLMVLDGLDDDAVLLATDDFNRGKSLLGFVPVATFARLLVTTRSKELAMRQVKQNDEHVIDVPDLADSGKDASMVLLGKISSETAKLKSVLDVTKALGGSAGALTLAYSYLKKVEQVSLRSYLGMTRLPTATAEASTAGVMLAWRLLYQDIQKNHRESASLLRRIGVLDVQSLPTPLLSRSELNGQLDRLVDCGMVEPSADRKVVSMTAIIRDCVQQFLLEAKEKDVVEMQVLTRICERFEEHEVKDSESGEVFLPAAMAAVKFQPPSAEGKRHVATLLLRIGQHYLTVGHPRVAIEYLTRCRDYKVEDPAKHRDLLDEAQKAMSEAESQLSLAEAKETTAEAEPDPLKIIAEVSRDLGHLERGASHYDAETLRKASDLAALKMAHGNAKGGEASKITASTIGHRTSSVRTETANADNAVMLKVGDGSGKGQTIKNSHGRGGPEDTAEANDVVSLFELVHDWCREQYGEDNLNTAWSLFNLGLAYEDQLDYEKAAKLYNRAAQIVERYHVPGSPELMVILRAVACMHCRQGHLEYAQQAFSVVLQGQKARLGWDHPETLVTRQNAAMLLEEMGRIGEAGAQLEEVLRMQVRLLGCEDQAPLRTACSLAMNYELRGRRKDAEKLLRATAQVQEKALGKTHRDTMATKSNLDNLLRLRGKGNKRVMEVAG